MNRCNFQILLELPALRFLCSAQLFCLEFSASKRNGMISYMMAIKWKMIFLMSFRAFLLLALCDLDVPSTYPFELLNVKMQP